MNNAPAVFVPTQPESDGLTLPTLLSLLAHGIVIGLLIYNFQSTEVETVGSIETIMVSPEQLAEMQSQILANQAAASSGNSLDNLPSGAINDAPLNPNDMSTKYFNPNNPSTSSANSAAPATSQRVPVFLQSNEPSDSSTPILMSQEQQQLLTEQAQEHEQNVAESVAQQEALANERLDSVEQNRQEEQAQVREQLKEFKNKESSTPKIERPNNKQRNIEITSGSGGKNYNLSEGQSTFSGESATSSPTKGSSSSASSGSRGASNSEIISLIKRNYNPPIASKGSVQRTTLTITVNASGTVTHVSASGSNTAVNDAAKQAVMNAGSLPIDVNDPKYPTFTIQFNGSN